MIFNPSGDLDACNKKVKQLTHCIEIANLINSELDIDRLLKQIMTTTRRAFNADSVSLLLKSEETGDLIFHVVLGEKSDEIKQILRVKKNQGIAGLVASTGIPLNLKDVEKHPDFSPDYDNRTGYRTHSMMCAPLKNRGTILGVIQIINKLSPPGFFSADELDMLVTVSASAAVAIDTAKMHRAILLKETLERDLKLAWEVQQSFLPADSPSIPGYAFAGTTRPALGIGGDFYHYVHLTGHRLGIVVGDVSGKGISASLFMARLISDLQYHCLLYPEPGQLLTRMNALLSKRFHRGMFVTLIYLVLHIRTGRITLANAGHPTPVLIRNKTARFLENDRAKGPPLGIVPGIKYEQAIWELAAKDSVLVFTDGITEAKDPARELFGMERLLETIRRHPDREPEQLLKDIVVAVDLFSQGMDLADDLTLVNFQIL
jgi:phosphoserine phosphatase RsbU/P